MVDEVDPLTASLRDITSEVPEARVGLNREEKLKIIEGLGGVKTARSLQKAKRQLPRERIPFLFNTLDSQLIVDFLANDMENLLLELEYEAQKNR